MREQSQRYKVIFPLFIQLENSRAEAWTKICWIQVPYLNSWLMLLQVPWIILQKNHHLGLFQILNLELEYPGLCLGLAPELTYCDHIWILIIFVLHCKVVIFVTCLVSIDEVMEKFNVNSPCSLEAMYKFFIILY